MNPNFKYSEESEAPPSYQATFGPGYANPEIAYADPRYANQSYQGQSPVFHGANWGQSGPAVPNQEVHFKQIYMICTCLYVNQRL